MAQSGRRGVARSPCRCKRVHRTRQGNRYHMSHLADDPDSDYWMWDFRYEDLLFPSNEPGFAIATPHVATAGTATVTVRLHGALEATHRARITLRGAVTQAHTTRNGRA